MLLNGLSSFFKHKEDTPVEKKDEDNSRNIALTTHEEKSPLSLDANLEKQMKIWRENPRWIDHPPEIEVTVPEGSLCNLNMKFRAGLPPDAIFNILIDPGNKRVFKNIKEVISRNVLVDEGFRQVVEVEQAAIWRFLWWSGTFSVHVCVDQNRATHTVKFKQGKSGFMKKFEGSWSINPLFVDEDICSCKPTTLAEYDSYTGGRGRVGSLIQLEQLVQPAIVIPPPISWYVRGITTRTIEMLISDLRAETARLRGSLIVDEASENKSEGGDGRINDSQLCSHDDVKKRWHERRRSRR